ncbi:MAG: hypothetical protein AMJ78_08360 [Omnitrophica WOR_2 bacterium SM23_29]|nr:MAG: hypothetical protein AMJ78_08360 [Omnitrophica WOR_2 bacterium SM23_29]
MKDKLTTSLRQMSGTVVEMLQLIYQGLMENDAHYLNSALNKERIIDDLEKRVTTTIVGIAKTLDEKERKGFVLLEQTAQNFERMGDEMRSLIERIEIKIAEKLLFSDIGVEQYKEVFNKMHESVNLITKFIAEGNNEFLDAVLKNGEQIRALIERYRLEHLERLTKGICDPRAANMYFDMLDFTGNIARHCTNIARIHKGE